MLCTNLNLYLYSFFLISFDLRFMGIVCVLFLFLREQIRNNFINGQVPGGGGEDCHVKRTGMLLVPFRG